MWTCVIACEYEKIGVRNCVDMCEWVSVCERVEYKQTCVIVYEYEQTCVNVYEYEQTWYVYVT